MQIVLYSRRGCHLCEQVEDLLAVHAPGARIVDIDADPELRRRFDARVPVVEVGGAVIAEGRCDERQLRERLAAAGAVTRPG